MGYWLNKSLNETAILYFQYIPRGPGARLSRSSELCRLKWVKDCFVDIERPYFDCQTIGCVTADLQSLLLWRQGVDDSDPPGFSRESSHLVALVPPPWLAKVGGPVAARSSGWHVHKAASRGVVPHALRLRIHKLEDLRRVGWVRWENGRASAASILIDLLVNFLTSSVSGSNQLLMSFPANSMIGRRRTSPAHKHDWSHMV